MMKAHTALIAAGLFLLVAGGCQGLAVPQGGLAASSASPGVTSLSLAGEKQDVTLAMTFHIRPSGRARVTFTTLIPQSLAGRQVVKDIRYSHEPTRVFNVGENAYATFELPAVAQPTDLTVTAEMELARYDIQTATGDARPPLVEPVDARLYLSPERYIECDNAEIKAFAAKADGKDELARIQATYNAVMKRMHPSSYRPDDAGALMALRDGTGDCTEYSDLLVASLRSQGVAARVCEGLIAEYYDVPRHAWVEAFTSDYGWVPLDPAQASGGQASFLKLKPMYIYLSRVRNDATLHNGHSWYCSFWGAQVNITEKVAITKHQATIAAATR
jgi:hypothetical protein